MVIQNNQNQDINQIISKGLNYQGDPFKIAIREELKNRIGLKYLNEEWLIDIFNGIRLDLVFEYHMAPNPKMLFVIECKKVYEKKYDWLFIEQNDRKFSPELMSVRLHKDQKGIDMHSERIIIPDITTVFEGYRLQKYAENKKEMEDKKILNKDEFDDALLQINKNYIGFLEYLKSNKGCWNEEDEFVTIPMIITNANLLILKNIKKNVSLSNMEVDETIINKNIQAVDYLLIRKFSDLSKYNFQNMNNYSHSINELVSNTDMGIFIINAQKITSFLNILNDIF